MAENLSLQAPDFPRIKADAGIATSDAVKILWQAMNFEMGRRRQDVRLSKERVQPKVLTDVNTVSQNNYDLEGSGILLLTGGTFNITGFRAPSDGESFVLFGHNIGAGTITLVHASASSDAQNRIQCFGAANIAVATDQSFVLIYLNSLWRELSLA